MIALALFCVACAAWALWKQHNTKSDEPPLLPGSWPIIGHALKLIGNSHKLWHTTLDVAEQIYSLGGVVTGCIGHRTVVTDPDDMLTVSNTCLDRNIIHDMLTPWTGEGLISAKPSTWKKHRKLFNPAFSQAVLDRFIGIFNSQSRKLVNDLNKEAGKGFFDHYDYIKSNILETLCLTDLAVNIGDSLQVKKYSEIQTSLINCIVERFLKIWWHSPYTFSFSTLKKEQDGYIQILHKLSDAGLQQRKIEFGANTCTQQDSNSGTRLKTFMELVLEASHENDGLDDKGIKAHLDTMIAAGQDTVSNALRYTLILLGTHPEVQEKVFAEIKEVVADGDTDVTKQDLSQLVYSEAVIKESMRVYSAVPVNARQLDRDVKLKNYTLMAGQPCLLFIFAVNRHPMWGPDRHEFRPERWLDPSRLPNNLNAFAPFGIGKRMCIAKTYAMMTMKMALAHLVRQYRITAEDSPLQLKFEFLLRPASGHLISIEKRT